jgi:hypothetical protein
LVLYSGLSVNLRNLPALFALATRYYSLAIISLYFLFHHTIMYRQSLFIQDLFQTVLGDPGVGLI